VAEVPFKAFLLLGLYEAIAGDGAMGVEKLVGDVGHDGGAAGGDAAFGDEDEEAGEKRFDVETGAELGEFGEEFGGEVFGVVLRRLGRSKQNGMAETKMGAGVQNSKTAAAAIGGEVTAAGRVVRFGLCRVRGVALGNAWGIGVELGLSVARVIGCSFLGKRRGTPSVEVKRVRKGLMAKELTSARCGGKCGRSWK
jgi:hypothetical protein